MRPTIPDGPYPQPRLWPHVGTTPMRIRTRIMISIVLKVIASLRFVELNSTPRLSLSELEVHRFAPFRVSHRKDMMWPPEQTRPPKNLNKSLMQRGDGSRRAFFDTWKTMGAKEGNSARRAPQRSLGGSGGSEALKKKPRKSLSEASGIASREGT